MLVKDALMYLIKRLILLQMYKLHAVLISSPEQPEMISAVWLNIYS